MRAKAQDMIIGSTDVWIDTLVCFATEQCMNTFIFWSVAGDERDGARRWAEDVVPAVRERL